MSKKPKIKNILTAAAFMTVLVIGTAFAFFTDTETALNNFTVGDVEVSLEEPLWDPDAGENITPNKVIPKNPMLTNTGANPAYVFIKVSVPKANVTAAAADGSKEAKEVRELFTYSVNPEWTQISVNDSGECREYVYAYGTDSVMTELDKGARTSAIFDSVKFINIIEGQLDGEALTMPVTSYAIQTTDLGKTAPTDIYRMIAVQEEA